MEGTHCTYLKVLSQQSQVKSSNCFFLEAVGKAGRLREIEDKKGTCRGKDQRTEPRKGIQDVGSNQGTGPASSYRFFLVFYSYQFFSSVGSADKGLIVTLGARSCPFPFGRCGFFRRRQLIASLENVHSQQRQTRSLGKQCEKGEGAEGRFN